MVLPSIPSIGWGCFFPCLLLGFFPLWVVSPVWRCCLHPLFWVWQLFPMSSVGWCCLVPSPFWVVCCFSFSCLVVLPSFSSFRWGRCCSVSSSFWWCCCFSFSCLVVLPCFSSFWWDCFIPRLLLGGAASPSFWVVLLFFPSPVGWCCLVSSFLGVVFLSFYVVLLGFFPLWVVSPVWWILSSSSSFGRGCFIPRLLLGGAAWSPPPFGGVAVFPSPVWWCCFPSPPLGGAAFSHVFCCVVLLGLLRLWRCFPLLLGGCCLVSSPFWWCCCFFLLLLGGAGRQHGIKHRPENTSLRKFRNGLSPQAPVVWQCSVGRNLQQSPCESHALLPPEERLLQ